MKHIIVTIGQDGDSEEFDVIARSTIDAILLIIDRVNPAKPFMVSGRVEA